MNNQSHVVLMILLISMSLILAEKKLLKIVSQNESKIKKQKVSSSKTAIEPNFESLCSQITLKSGIYLEAKCNKKNVSVNLTECLGNFYGKLVYTKNGSFNNSCNKCSLKEKKQAGSNVISYFFECSCPDLSKKYQITQVNLNDVLYVKSNSLLCDDVLKSSELEETVNPGMIDTNCSNVDLVSNTRVTAACTNGNSMKSANRVNVDFNLNNCISNQNGRMVPGVNGNFGGSCNNCKITQKNNINFLSCKCADIVDAFKLVESPLNKFITFRGNSIRCFSSEDDNNVSINVKPTLNTSTNIPAAPAVVEKLVLNKKLSAADNFMILCKKLQIENVNFLRAFCGPKNTEYSLNLNTCFSNIDGTLKVQKDGDYAKSCKKCELKFDLEEQYVLQCNCQRADQIRWMDTGISLRERVIYNETNNALECLTDVVLPEDSSNKVCTKS